MTRGFDLQRQPVSKTVVDRGDNVQYRILVGIFPIIIIIAQFAQLDVLLVILNVSRLHSVV